MWGTGIPDGDFSSQGAGMGKKASHELWWGRGRGRGFFLSVGTGIGRQSPMERIEIKVDWNFHNYILRKEITSL